MSNPALYSQLSTIAIISTLALLVSGTTLIWFRSKLKDLNKRINNLENNGNGARSDQSEKTREGVEDAKTSSAVPEQSGPPRPEEYDGEQEPDVKNDETNDNEDEGEFKTFDREV